MNAGNFRSFGTYSLIGISTFSSVSGLPQSQVTRESEQSPMSTPLPSQLLLNTATKATSDSILTLSEITWVCINI